MMNTFNNDQMTPNADGKIFNPVTKRHIKNNVINRNSIKSQIEHRNSKRPPIGTFKLIVFFMDGFKYEGLFPEKNMFCCDLVDNIREARAEDDTTDYKFFLDGCEDELIKFDMDESNNYFGIPFRCEPVIKFNVGRFRVISENNYGMKMNIVAISNGFIHTAPYNCPNGHTKQIKIRKVYNHDRLSYSHYFNIPLIWTRLTPPCVKSKIYPFTLEWISEN